MDKGKTAGGLLARLREGSSATRPMPIVKPGTQAALPWDDARVAAILGPAAERKRRRLIFAMDATGSRQPTWDKAMEEQSAMFSAFTAGLEVQLVYFHGREFRASGWSRKPEELAGVMRGVACVAGLTQIARVLAHTFQEAERGGVAALVYVGDCMEESAQELAALARKLGSRAVKAFLFHEGDDPGAAASFRTIAELTRGAYCHLGSQSAAELKELLAAAAAYAAGGRESLARLAEAQPAARLLLTQMK